MAERKPKRAAPAAGFDLPAEQSRVMKSKWESRDKAAGPAAQVGVKALGLARPLAPKEKRLVGAGDSWFQYGLFRDVLDCLQDDFGYDIRKEAAPGATCNTLVYEWLTNALPLIKKHQPKAFLFSGGGNDIAGPEFILMLNHRRSGLPALNRGVAEAVVASLRHAYETMIRLTNHYCATEYREIVPIVVHGYADPVPDGRGVIWFGPWLGPSFDKMGWDDMEVRKAVMREVMGLFNAMLAGLSRDFNNVHHLDLRNVLAQTPADWANELHPTAQGFEKVAEAFDKLIKRLP
jgi:hypothetical protein